MPQFSLKSDQKKQKNCLIWTHQITRLSRMVWIKIIVQMRFFPRTKARFVDLKESD